MQNFAVIDTETTYSNQVMSIGIVISNSQRFRPEKQKYYVITPLKSESAMYSGVLYIAKPDLEGSRKDVMTDILKFLKENKVQKIFAYNAKFDHGLLPELHGFEWYDIMKLTAYKQYNKKIPKDAELSKTGRMKSGYGVENMLRLLRGDPVYCETHNAVRDSLDELEIMRLLGHGLEVYEAAKITIGVKL